MSLTLVEHALSAALDSTAASVAPVADAAQDFLTPLRTLSTGGKRLRAQLLLAAHAAHGGTHADAAAQVAAAIELFQTAALIHDDVLDQADTRRGSATIHRQLASLHADSEWHGESGHFGVSGAILAGDIALMASHLALSRAAAALPPASGLAVAELFSQMSQLCTAGQYADMRLAAQPVGSLPHQEDAIMAMMRSKTASYTAEFPLALGAACAEAGEEAIATMRAVGVPLGIAFQLRDDVLGLVGSPGVTGKPAGDDVREGKRTVLMVHAWSHADADARTVIAAGFARPDASEAVVADAVAAIVVTGAVAATEERIAAHVSEARVALESAAPALPNADALDQLHALLEATTQRTA
jgi:geranylgeranyl diphosphate synthase type I